MLCIQSSPNIGYCSYSELIRSSLYVRVEVVKTVPFETEMLHIDICIQRGIGGHEGRRVVF